MRILRFAPAALSLAIGLAGCGSKPDVPPPAAASVQPATPPAIEWFAGDVNAAFAQAAAQGKPVFLYWGASWCPPCHELKATVFSRPEFIEKLKLFVPVYIDGDAPGAQKWGDEFRVSGYPSVVVLRADRTELARINGGMDLSLYANVLDLVLGDVPAGGAAAGFAAAGCPRRPAATIAGGWHTTAGSSMIRRHSSARPRGSCSLRRSAVRRMRRSNVRG